MMAVLYFLQGAILAWAIVKIIGWIIQMRRNRRTYRFEQIRIQLEGMHARQQVAEQTRDAFMKMAEQAERMRHG